MKKPSAVTTAKQDGTGDDRWVVVKIIRVECCGDVACGPYVSFRIWSRSKFAELKERVLSEMDENTGIDVYVEGYRKRYSDAAALYNDLEEAEEATYQDAAY